VAALSLVALTVAVLQTAVVPILGIIAHQLNASSVAVSWAVTPNLLAAAASTPLIGRLADLHNKKRVLLSVLVTVLVGSVLAATTTSLALLVFARVLHGFSYALYPICVAILRDELPEGQVVGALSVLSGTLGFGGGAGLVVTGLLMDGAAGYHRVFWLATGFVVVVIAAALLAIPSRAGGAETPTGVDHDAQPSTGIADQSRDDIRRDGFVFRLPRPYAVRPDRPCNRRIRFQRIGFARQRGVSAARRADRVRHGNPQRQIHRPLGSPAHARQRGADGRRRFPWLAFAHSQPWQVIAAGIWTNAYISLAYGALPALVVSEVDGGETGLATGVNVIARTVGSAMAAAVVAVLLGRPMATTGMPPEHAFVTIFIAGAVTAALAMVLIAVSRGRRRDVVSVEPKVHSRAMNHDWG
jgi:predicted MFS family arabinose efflux permease